MTEKPKPRSLEAGRAEYRRRHPKPPAEREHDGVDVASSGLAKGGAVYASRRGNRSARNALIEAAEHRPDNVGDGAG